jgi:hypothetical protein
VSVTKVTELKPGQSVFDHDNPERARYVHSVEEQPDGMVRVRFGHPDGEPDADPDDIGTVEADKEYDVIADSDGTRL